MSFLTTAEQLVLGGSSGTPSQSEQTSTTVTPPAPSSPIGLYIGIGATVLILSIVAGVLLTKAHNAKKAAAAAALTA